MIENYWCALNYYNYFLNDYIDENMLDIYTAVEAEALYQEQGRDLLVSFEELGKR